MISGFENLQRNLRSEFQFGRESDRRRCLGRCRGRNRLLTGAGIRRLRSGIGIAEEAEEIVVDHRIRILIAGDLKKKTPSFSNLKSQPFVSVFSFRLNSNVDVMCIVDRN